MTTLEHCESRFNVNCFSAIAYCSSEMLQILMTFLPTWNAFWDYPGLDSYF